MPSSPKLDPAPRRRGATSSRRALVGAEVRDEELVARAADGDRWAQEALFRRHVGSLLATMRHVTRNEADADDVVQDAFAEALSTLERLRDPGAFRWWLYRIALHRARKLLRRRRFLSYLGWGEALDATCPSAFVATDASPETAAEVAMLERALGHLPEEERIAWTLRHVRGEALDDIAAWLGCSLATVKRRIDAAEATLEKKHLRGGRG